MDLNELRKAAFEKFTKADEIQKKAEAEKRDLTDAEKTEYRSLIEEVAKRNAELVRLSEHEALRARFNQSANQPFKPVPVTVPGEYRTAGAWAAALFRKEERAFNMTTGSAGGLMIPEQFLPEIMALKPEASIVRSRAMVVGAEGDSPDAAIRLPYLVQGANGVYGGMSSTYKAESGTQTEQTAALNSLLLEPKEVGDYIILTDQLMRNSGVMTAFVKQLFQDTINGMEDYNFLRGNGVGAPKGVLNADAKIAVTRNTATDVKYTDITTMLKKFLPESWGVGVWVANVSTLDKLLALADGNNNNVFIRGDATKSIPNTLFGMPIILTGKVPTLGTAGDLGLFDFSKYIIKDGSGPYFDTSPHFLFTTNKTVAKGYRLSDGQPWVVSALRLEDGVNYVSPFVVLS